MDIILSLCRVQYVKRRSSNIQRAVIDLYFHVHVDATIEVLIISYSCWFNIFMSTILLDETS